MIERDLIINCPCFNSYMLRRGAVVRFDVKDTGYEGNGIVCDVTYDKLSLTMWNGETGSIRHIIELEDVISGRIKIKIL